MEANSNKHELSDGWEVSGEEKVTGGEVGDEGDVGQEVPSDRAAGYMVEGVLASFAQGAGGFDPCSASAWPSVVPESDKGGLDPGIDLSGK